MNRLKLITLVLIGVFTLTITSNTTAQQIRNRTESRQSIENNDRQVNKCNNNQKGQRKLAKRQNKANKAHLKALRRMAAADGKIHPKERKMLQRQKRKLNNI